MRNRDLVQKAQDYRLNNITIGDAMAGIRQFDTNAVLNSAMQVFWALGYEATTIHDLTEATGLGRGSLYGAFQNKEGLFIAAIDYYLERSRLAFFAALEKPDLLDALHSALDVFRGNLVSDTSQPGCLLVIAAENSELKAKRIHRRVARAFAEEEQAFHDRLVRARNEKSIAEGLDLRSIARFLGAQSRGLGITARVSRDPNALSDIISITINAMDHMLSIPQVEHDSPVDRKSNN